MKDAKFNNLEGLIPLVANGAKYKAYLDTLSERKSVYIKFLLTDIKENL